MTPAIMILRLDPTLVARQCSPMTWIPSDSASTTTTTDLAPPVVGQLPPPSSLLFPPPPPVQQMEETDASTAHKSCLAKRPLMAPYSEAAKALLSSPLPPELVVDFKGSLAISLRNSTSENNVHHMPADSSERRLDGACRTLSDGARKSYARRKLESEDSSYDSDYECSDSLSLALTSPLGDNNNGCQFPVPGNESISVHSQHEDVSRTVSDTLAAEFNEYVCVSHSPSFQRLKETARDDSDDSDESPLAGINDPSYSSRVEFALKLGYTEQQVQKALVKLGLHPTQNELLAELIRLASLAGPASGSTEGMVEADYVHQRHHRPLSISSSDEAALRHVVIDGSNVAISHGNKEIFSCRGIQLCVDWFRARGHREITVFVPMWRKETSKIDAPIANQEILLELEKERMLVFTPSRQVGGRRLVCYDDRYILRLAAETDGIVVSNDNYRDLVSENPEYRKIVEERILMYSFVNDRFMPPEDPLGRNGPKLDRFLRKPPARGSSELTGAPPCPYGKKCTYGNKCKYYHPERGNVPQKTISERLAEQAAHRNLEAAKSRTQPKKLNPSTTCGKTFSLPLSPSSKDSGKPPVKKTPLTRTKSIVPSLSLLPPELTEERPVHDKMPEDVGPTILKSRSVENVARLSPVRSIIQPPPIMIHAPPPPAFSVPPPPMDGFVGNNPNWNRHVSVCQQLSDPASPSSDPSAESDDSRPNPHRKVQRQLTLNPLNPACDPRLYTLKGLAPPYPPPPIAVHSIVTRNASAPAPTSQLHHGRNHPHVQPTGPNHMQRLNSTSDTQLNLYGAAAAGSQDWSSHVGLTDPFEEWTSSPPPPLPPPATIQQHSWASRTSSLPAHQHLSCETSGSNIKSETRYKLFYHLAAIFPEEQVRQVMSLMPDETNAQKICAAILALYPKDN